MDVAIRFTQVRVAAALKYEGIQATALARAKAVSTEVL